MADAKAAVNQAEVEAAEGAPAAKGSFLRRLPGMGLVGKIFGLNKFILIGIVVALIAIAGGGYFMFGGQKAADGPKAAAKSVFFDMPEMTVNLSASPERPQYLRVKITLEADDNGVIDAIKPVMPRVVDAFQVHLRELRVTDLEGSAGLYRLREELTRRVNLAIAPNRIRAVLFKEIVVQ
ncbi:MAG TPA: flagellar basal body-associated FliL family protein [Xanthobacteraceae bacterium]|jgi:flagellar protein FliL|nr:flagellar basal body-associated FliL family protein [Xanthobacteraceae bacterium]